MKNFSKKKKATMRNDEEGSGQVAQLPTRGSFIFINLQKINYSYQNFQ
jgi:hypothetical protein